MKNCESLTLLYVEDDQEIAQHFISLLARYFHEILHAPNGKLGVGLFKQYNPDIIVSDIMMPEMDGLEMSEEIKTLSPSTPIIIASAFNDSQYLHKAIEIGVDGYLFKPFLPSALQKELEKTTERILQTKELKRSHHLVQEYQKVIDTTAICSATDTKGIITYANKAFEEISGYTREELIGKKHSIVRHPDMPKEAFEDLWHTIKNGQIWKGIIKNRRKDGSSYTVESIVVPITDSNGEITEYLGIRHDITDMTTRNLYLQDIAKKNEEMAHQKSKELIDQLYLDSNTGLPNILSLQRDIKNCMDGTLFILDINNFNIYNKMHGFDFGDKILKSTAADLKQMLSSDERLYKLGADRFAIMLEKYDLEHIENLCNQIFAFFDNTDVIVDTIENLITFSIGVAQINREHDTIMDAEFALDLSKRYGKRFKIIYQEDSEDIKKEQERIILLNKARDYIYRDLITPYYQPIVDVQTKELYKYEALARVKDGDEIIRPDLFLNAAARLGLITSITKSMINKTFAQFSGTDTKFSINITERDILDGYLMEFIKIKCEKYNIHPANVTFEVLENLTLSQEGEMVTNTISLIKDYGFDIAIDDFGSENSNFGRILSLKSDYIKIDGMFVKNCDVEEEKQKIIDAIVQLAKRLDIKTVAEYVSSESIYNTIKEIGVDYAQGYYFGKPEPLKR